MKHEKEEVEQVRFLFFCDYGRLMRLYRVTMLFAR